MVFDASGSRMAWTLIEQLQGELRPERLGKGQAGAELSAHLGGDQRCISTRWPGTFCCLALCSSGFRQ